MKTSLAMSQQDVLETLAVWAPIVTAAGTVALAIMAVFAWSAAKGTLEASRQASRAAEEANKQAQRDSIEQTRPYVVAEVVPGLSGMSSYDVRLANTGRSSARDLTLEFDSWPTEPDDVAQSVQTLFHTPRTLTPGSSLRAMWRLQGDFTDDTTVAGMGRAGTIQVRYTSTDPTRPQYTDTFEVQLDTSGKWPVPEAGPDPDGITAADQRKFYLLGQALVRRVGELGR